MLTLSDKGWKECCPSWAIIAHSLIESPVHPIKLKIHKQILYITTRIFDEKSL